MTKNETEQAPGGADENFCVRLDAVQAEQVRRLAAAWGVSPGEVLTGLVSNHLGCCAAAVADLVPGPSAAAARRRH